jgi:hypothetical protein
MPVVVGLAGFNEMVEYLAERQRKAKDEITPVQAEMRVGDHYLMGTGEDGVLVFGEIRERPQLNGFCFCKAYSVCCPEGELGDAHLSAMVPIEPEEFEGARERGWDYPGVAVPAMQRMTIRNAQAKRTN